MTLRLVSSVAILIVVPISTANLATSLSHRTPLLVPLSLDLFHAGYPGSGADGIMSRFGSCNMGILSRGLRTELFVFDELLASREQI